MVHSYPEGFDRAFQLASTALAYMKKKGIPANPQNFMVWYEFFSGTNVKLKEAVQPLIQTNAEMSEKTSAELFGQFFSEQDRLEAIQSWSNRFEAVIGGVSSALAETDGSAREYGEALQSFNGGLEISGDVSEIKTMVSKIIGETKSMATHVEQLQAQVALSSEQVSQLSEELERAREDSLCDALTGIPNRRCFDTRLTKTMSNASASGEPLSLIMLDLDHFKSFNDKYGHPVGDQVLRIVGRTLLSLTKGKDTAARYGGEEFGIILPNTSLEGAVALAESIRSTISSKKLRRKGVDAPIEPLTVSSGVAAYVPGESAVALVDRADRALYAAKRSGRNRVVTADGEDAAKVAATA